MTRTLSKKIAVALVVMAVLVALYAV